MIKYINKTVKVINMGLKEKIRNLPSLPGVYLMKDSLGGIIYVGKSKNLKNRVGSYFQNSKSHSPKVLKLIKHLTDFEYIITDTEFEAFMLECKLIKEIKPLYNKKMKSPMSYSYVRIDTDAKYPSIEITNELGKGDKSRYFGPYANRNTVERGVQGIKECCRILCSNNLKKTSGCLNHSMGLCIGMCIDETSYSMYIETLCNIIRLLDGTDCHILENMEKMMDDASERFDFENAAKYRDYIRAVRYLINKARMVEFTKGNQNIALVEYLSYNTLKFFLIKGSRLLFSEKYSTESTRKGELKNIMKDNILSYFISSGSPHYMEISRDEVDDAQIIYSYINGGQNSCRHVIIPGDWIENQDMDNICAAVDKLLSRR